MIIDYLNIELTSHFQNQLASDTLYISVRLHIPFFYCAFTYQEIPCNILMIRTK